jgi:hypothetical protein
MSRAPRRSGKGPNGADRRSISSMAACAIRPLHSRTRPRPRSRSARSGARRAYAGRFSSPIRDGGFTSIRDVRLLAANVARRGVRSLFQERSLLARIPSVPGSNGERALRVDTGSSLCALPSQIGQFRVNSRRLRARITIFHGRLRSRSCSAISSARRASLRSWTRKTGAPGQRLPR